MFAFIILFIFVIIIFLNYHYGMEFFEDVLSKIGKNLKFDYGREKGPHTWRNTFPAARGCYQSPINIKTECADILRIDEPLVWCGYEDLPDRMIITNTGHTIDLRVIYNGNLPTLSGADLLETYCLSSICFRWGISDMDGSEHTINDRGFTMEMQVKHVSQTNTANTSNDNCDIGILMISYFFMITRNDNPYLDRIVSSLPEITDPCSCTDIQPFPIAWLCYPFKSGFYSYGGSMTEPPCSEGVTWFIQPEPLAISVKQLLVFRQLLSYNGSKIMKNCRPVQNINKRVVCYNKIDVSQT